MLFKSDYSLPLTKENKTTRSLTKTRSLCYNIYIESGRYCLKGLIIESWRTTSSQLKTEVLIMKIEERLLRLQEVLERVPFGKTVLFIKQALRN